MVQVFYRDSFDCLAGKEGSQPHTLIAEGVSAHLIVEQNERMTACCSVWWEGTPPHTDGICGTIGHFEAEDPRSAALVLERACQLLQEQNCVYVLAPMHGNTYRSYRYATEGTERPLFLMEPQWAGERGNMLEQCGFKTAYRYLSYLEPLHETSACEALGRISTHRIKIQPLDMGRLEQTLDTIYRLSCICFRNNPCYTDIAQDAFVAQYLSYQSLLIPQLILTAEKDGEPVGFLFCIPDYLENSDSKPNTLLFKTIAVLPQFQGMGVGAALLETARETAWKMGFTTAIGALIYEDNHSKQLLQHQEDLRRYTLYGKTL